MKKSLLFAGAIFLTSGIAIAKTIDFDTSIKWNSNVVELALNKSGFLGSYDAYRDVRVTHERILAELLKMDSFSVRDATRVCLDKCNMSDFLKNGRGASGKKCPDLCSGFADMLVAVNNELTETGNLGTSENGLVIRQADGTLKIYSHDKKYYAICAEKDSGEKAIQKYSNICTVDNETTKWYKEYGKLFVGVVFESQTNKAIAKLGEFIGEGGSVDKTCGVGKYDTFEIGLNARCKDYSYLEITDTYKQLFETVFENISQRRQFLRTADIVYEPSSPEVKKYLDENEYNERYRGIKEIVEASVEEWDNSTFTKDSYDKATQLEDFKERYNIYGKYDSEFKASRYDIKYANVAIEKIKSLNKQSINEDKRTFDNPQEAYNWAKQDIDKRTSYGLDTSKIQCSGDCKKIGDDTVVCTIGDVSINYIFDDICQSRIERAFDIF